MMRMYTGGGGGSGNLSEVCWYRGRLRVSLGEQMGWGEGKGKW